MITPEELKRIRELCDKASPSMWHVIEYDSGIGIIEPGIRYIIGVAGLHSSILFRGNKDALADAKFIAESRTALPKLLDEIDRLNSLLDGETDWHSIAIQAETDRDELREQNQWLLSRMEKELSENERLNEEIKGLNASLIGQEHRLGTQNDKLSIDLVNREAKISILTEALEDIKEIVGTSALQWHKACKALEKVKK